MFNTCMLLLSRLNHLSELTISIPFASLHGRSFLLYMWSEVKSLSHVRLFATPWTVAYHAPLSMGFSRQECWSGLPFPSPGYLPDPGNEPGSPALEADALTSEPSGKPLTLWGTAKLIPLFYSSFLLFRVFLDLWGPLRTLSLASFCPFFIPFETISK